MKTFGALFSKWTEKYQKSIMFSLKVDAVLRFRKTSKNL